jgi:hypothetical protein
MCTLVSRIRPAASREALNEKGEALNEKNSTNKRCARPCILPRERQLEVVPEKYFSSIHEKEIPMTNAPSSGSGDQKPNTPVNPQQNQTNPPKPADKPAEQQK